MARWGRAGYRRAKLFLTVRYVLVYRSSMGGCWGPRREAVHTIHFRSYNIRNGWNSGIDSDLKEISQSNVALGVFQEPKVTKGIYMRDSGGYWVMVTEAPSVHRDGVVVFYPKA